MTRVAIATLVTSVLLAGCGSGSTGADPAAAPTTDTPRSATTGSSAGATASKPADATYFADDDTAVINQAAAAAQAAGARATSARRMTACNRIDAYPAWRRCWRALLDPYVQRLGGLVSVLTSLRKGGFPAGCEAELAAGARAFASFAEQVEALLAGIDSDDRSAQVRSARRYGPTLARIDRDFAKPFQDLTQVCYSPKDLASINASPSPSPGS